MTTKPTLLSYKQQARLTTKQIADEAGVSLGDTYAVEIGGFADDLTTHKVVDAFSRLSGIQLRTQDIARGNAQRRLP